MPRAKKRKSSSKNAATMAASVNKKQRIDSIDTTDSETNIDNTNTSENSDVSLNVGDGVGGWY